MKKTLLSLACSGLAFSFVGALVVTGCSSSSSPTVPASVSGASPNQAFAGRTLDITLSGSGTNWDGTEMVSFGDGVTVNKVSLASAAALIANVTVANDAMIGPRDITVTKGTDAEAYKMSFQIVSPADVTVVGTPAQGSIVGLTIANHDFDNLFDDTSMGDGLFTPITYPNIAITAPSGVTAQVSSVTPFRIEATLLIDADASTGSFDLVVKSGPDGSASQFTFKKPALFNITARTPMAITGTTATFAVGMPGDSQLYTYTPAGADHILSFDVMGDDPNASPIVVLLDKSGQFMNLLGNGPSVQYTTTSADALTIIIWDAGATGMYNAALDITDTALTVQNGEGNDNTNKDPNGATALMTPPVIVKGASLSSGTDVDCYSLTVTAGKSIHARTVPGDQNTDTTIQFYDTTKTAMGMLVDQGYQEDTTSDPVPTTGTYYICIGASPMFDPSASNYNLIVTLE
jgi:hypothetical protein